jgi:tRNA (guanine-N7-)-methyltransferase
MVTFDEVSVAPEALGPKADLGILFSNGNPVELEIGCGKGGFLLRQAQAHPDRNYLGIEWAFKFHRFAADRMARWRLPNVRILRADARHFVIHRLPPACLVAVHAYHPDPWPKKRHHKRRLFTAQFVEALARVLVPGGRLSVQTDHAEYFEQIRSVTRHPAFRSVAPTEIEPGAPGQPTDTNYEIKYLREGRTIYRLQLLRTNV